MDRLQMPVPLSWNSEIHYIRRTVVAVLCDTQIRELIGIEPFEENNKRPGKVSYGVSSYGYDVRVGTLFKIFTNVSRNGGASVVDPKNFSDDLFVTVDTRNTNKDHVIIPPNSFALCETVEIFTILRFSQFRAMCWRSAWASRPTPAAASS
jgi:hypothetical protein